MMKYCYETYRQLDAYFKVHIPQMKPVRPDGTFILWVDCRDFGFENDTDLESFFLTAGFCCDSGEQYGSEPGFIRMNLAAPRADIFRVMDSLSQMVNSR